ncbi:hypothetical protein C8F04DRAFT_1189864 [Mycena alexandri]|uniref:Uncharacterized protein n=1 Tax=Mycena alexandri TaxID=1745969 RepID=A0AAD6WVW3_9AGAR|nr:hypothetical protein C8F04DRAFT_1189864 [Mycena alexandri]
MSKLPGSYPGSVDPHGDPHAYPPPEDTPMLDASLHPLPHNTSMVDASAVNRLNTMSAANNPPPTRAEGVPMEEDSTAQWARQSDENNSKRRAVTASGSVRARLDNATETTNIARTRAIEALREKKEMAGKLAEAQQALDALKQQTQDLQQQQEEWLQTQKSALEQRWADQVATMKGELEVARTGLNRQFNRDLAVHKKQAADQLQEDVRLAEAAREADHKAKLAQLEKKAGADSNLRTKHASATEQKWRRRKQKER